MWFAGLREACQQIRMAISALFLQPPFNDQRKHFAKQFAQPDLVSEISSVLRQTGLAPSCLNLEITETVAIHFDRPVREPPPLTSLVSPCGPATLWGRVQSMGDGCRGSFSNFGPSIKIMLPTVRKAVRGRYDGCPNRYTVQRPDGA